jgi:hypothetical protein
MAHDRPLLLSACSPRPLLVRTQSGLFELQRSLNLMQGAVLDNYLRRAVAH